MKMISLKKCITFFVLTLFFIIGTEMIAKDKDTPIIITDAWVRPSQVETSAAYMTIENTGSVLDQLLNAQTDVCERVELHRIEKVHRIFRMRPVEAIDVPSETATILRPSGMHLMLMKLKHPLKVGEKVILHLNFRKAGTMTIEAEVRHIQNKGRQPMYKEDDSSQLDKIKDDPQVAHKPHVSPISKG